MKKKSNVLITTLGKGRPVTPEAQGVGRYKEVRYRFDDGDVSLPTTFFGAALREHLEKNGTRIDRIVILGTSGSMWDAWLEVDVDFFIAHEELALRLQKAQEADSIAGAELQKLAKVLSERAGVPVDCRRIPYGVTEEEQLGILRVISTCANEGDSVYMDVTHGLRHLPMLELQSAFLMKAKFETKGLYYGAFERKDADGLVPVVPLTGALRINEWNQAVSILRETGNVAPLARLPGMESFREALLNCQFYEQMNNVAQSRRFACDILKRLEDLPEEGRLFEGELRKAFEWGNEQKYARRQFRQAQKAFDNGDDLRSVTLLMETAISAYIEGDAVNRETRDEVQEKLNKQHIAEWHCLRQLRNSLVHGGAPSGRGADEVLRMRKSEADFKAGMAPLFKWVESILPKG